MGCDYQAIQADNRGRYGTEIGRIGHMLLADRYDDRTHFIFELLQNAEDALTRRPAKWQGSRSITFHLSSSKLRVSHFGEPFDESDVRGICGIAEGTKEHQSAIGQFGIGFKSVYAFTDRPEVHSGTEDFAIESFVSPVRVPSVERDPDETVFVLPFRRDDPRAFEDVVRGLRQLGATSLLFLRQLEEIHWEAEGGPSGVYLRESDEVVAGVRRVTVIGQQQGKPEIDETWLVFSQPVSENGHDVGNVEIAFVTTDDQRLRRVERSPLVVFFPTVVETHLGFLVQGPYRTTPTRDNVRRDDLWNQRLVGATGSLLVETLRWLRDQDMLDTMALLCLPVDSAKFPEGSMFRPVFDASLEALSSEPLLPRFDRGHASAARARLARTRDLRELFTPMQLAAVFGETPELSWLSSDITQDRTPELRQYLMQELGVAEVTPETILSKLDAKFLQVQPDAWILDLYHFLHGQPALRPRLSTVPLVRMEDGTHVPAHVMGQPQAFLPGATETGFPTVRTSVCATEDAREFLLSLGLAEPDPVDDVIRNVLPKYRMDGVDVSDAEYEADMRRTLTAFATDSTTQRERLTSPLRATAFVKAVEAGDGSRHLSRPGELYLATERLKELFRGVGGVLIVDDAHACLRGEDVRKLLEACGAARHLRPIGDSTLSWEERRKLRERAGHPQTSGQNDRITDRSLAGLAELLETLPKIDHEQRVRKAKLLWEELASLEERRGKGIFTGEYTWTHNGSYRKAFDAAFVRLLNETPWVPVADGDLKRPGVIPFDGLGWKPHPFLQSKIRFKPPLLDQLAQEAGIEPGVLQLLKQLGVTSEVELRRRLKEEMTTGAPAPSGKPEPTGSGGRGREGAGNVGAETGKGTEERASASGGREGRGKPEGSPRAGDQTSETAHNGEFISYVGVRPDVEEPDPDGLDHSARMGLEETAIGVILDYEPHWQRTPANNPGFDLYEADAEGRPMRWCEVKAMTGSLRDRPVGLSSTQFEYAQEHGDAYFVYVVEHAGTERARIVRIHDPAGKARTFTLDRGWLAIAEVGGERPKKDRDGSDAATPPDKE